MTTGGLTAAAAASAKMEPCAIPSLEPATVHQVSKVGAVKNAAVKGHTEMIAIKNVSAKMEPPATM